MAEEKYPAWFETLLQEPIQGDSLEGSLDFGLPDLAGAEPLGGSSEGAGPGSNVLNRILNAGSDTFWNLIDALNRPRQAVQHGGIGTLRKLGVMEGDPDESFRQVWEQFDPFNLMTPDTPAMPVFGSDILRDLGMAEGPQIPLLGSSRAVGGFFLDLLTDPLTYPTLGLGPAISRGATTIAGETGRLSLAGLERSAAVAGPLGLPARGVLQGGGMLSNALKFRHARDYLARSRQGVDREMHGLELADAEARATARALKAVEKEYTNLPVDMLEQQKKLLTQALEQPGMRSLLEERKLIRKLGLPEDIPASENLSELRGYRVDAENLWDQMHPPVQNLATRWFDGNPEVFQAFGQNLGKIDREFGFLASGALTEERVRALMARDKALHVIHKRDPRSFANAQIIELAEILGEPAVMNGAELRGLIKRGASNQASLRSRELAGSLHELNEIMPGAFYHNLDDIAQAEVFRFAKVDTAQRFLREVGADPNIVKPAALATDYKGALSAIPTDPNFVVADLNRLPKDLHAAFTREINGVRYPVQMRREVWEDLTEKWLPKISRDPTFSGFRETINTLTRYGVGWTLALFPSTWVTNMSGGLWNNFLAGVRPNDYRLAFQSMFGPKANMRGISLGDKARLTQREAQQAASLRLTQGLRIPIGDVSSGVAEDLAAVLRRRNLPVPPKPPKELPFSQTAPPPAAKPAKEFLELPGKPQSDLLAAFEAPVRPDGSVDYFDFIREVREQRVLKGGFWGTPFGERLADVSLNPQKPGAWEKLLDPALNPATKFGFHVMQQTDDAMRLAHYIHFRRQGLSAAEAAASVKKYLYDGQTLTDVERTFIRPLMPFYGWMRFNVPQQIRAMVEHPAQYAQIGRLLLKADRDGRVELPKEVLPAFLQSKFAVISGKDNEGRPSVFMLNRWLPFAQIEELTSPKKLMNFLLNSTQPQLRNLIQQTIGEHGFDTFFKDTIESYRGEQDEFLGLRLSKRDIAFLRTFRVLNEIDKTFLPLIPGWHSAEDRTKKILAEMTGAERLTRFVAGRSYKINLREARLGAIHKYDREIRDLRGHLTRARRVRDLKAIPEIEALIREAQLNRQIAVRFDPTTHPALQPPEDEG